MRVRLVLVGLLVAIALTASLAAGAVETPSPTGPLDGAQLVAVYPNPTLAEDRGEFVVIEVPNETALGRLSLTDGETRVRLPARTGGGRLAVGTEPVVANLTAVPFVLVDGPFRLANRGERIELWADRRRLDTVAYPRAPEGAIYRRQADGWTWRQLGATDFPIWTAHDVDAELFVLPDAPAVPLEVLDSASDRLWVAGYTLTDGRVASTICGVAARGVDTRLLVELDPVGGMAVEQARLLDRLAGCGVRVRVIGPGPYTFHHPKYAVADDRAIVLTENWKPSGVGGRSSRGWGVVVESQAIADGLARVFAADAEGRATADWAVARSTRSITRVESAANGTYPTVHEPVRVSATDVEVVLAPETAESRVIALIAAAESSVDVIQVSVGGPSQPFVRALLRAARRGVAVRLLLADAWYVADDNRAVATRLEATARNESIPLSVKLAVPRGRFEKIHAKGVIVDGDRVLVGSLNWNNVSARENREVALLLHGESVGAYYTRVFDADWQGGRRRLPVGLVAAAGLLTIASALVARRTIEFEPAHAAGVEPDSPLVSPSESESPRRVGPW